LYQHMVVNIVKAALDIAFDKPFYPCEIPLHMLQRRMAAAPWPEAMPDTVIIL